MSELLHTLFLAALAGAVGWLAYLSWLESRS